MVKIDLNKSDEELVSDILEQGGRVKFSSNMPVFGYKEPRMLTEDLCCCSEDCRVHEFFGESVCIDRKCEKLQILFKGG